MLGQGQQTIENLGTALELLGGSLQDVVRVRAFLPQHCRPGRPGVPSFDETFDAVYGRYFSAAATGAGGPATGLFLEDLRAEALAVLNQPEAPDRIRRLATPAPALCPGRHCRGQSPLLARLYGPGQAGDLVGRGDMRAQTEQTFANMAVVLQEAGGSLADLVQTHVTLTDWHAYQDYNEVYNRHVREPFPTRATWQGGLGREGLLIEIESVAALGVPGSRLTLPYRSLDGPSYSVGRRDLRRAARPWPCGYAQAVRVGDLVFVSDQQGVEAQGRLAGPGDIPVRTRQALANLQNDPATV